MADNTTLPGTGEVYASDDLSGVKYQRCKVVWGVDGVAVDANLTTPLPVQLLTTSIYRLLSAATTNAQSAKGSTGILLGFDLINLNSSARVVKLYNKATAPTVGSDTPVMTIPLLGLGGIAKTLPGGGVPFSLGIGIAITSGVADADTGAVGLNDVTVLLYYI